MKKTAFIAAAALTAQLAVPAFAQYPDMTGHWAERFVDELTDEGIVAGDGTNFHPDNAIRSDEFIKMVIASMGIEVSSSGSDWAKPYIDKAWELGLIRVGEIDDFSVPITREQTAKICTRAIDANPVSEPERTLLISKITDYYDIYNNSKEYVLAAYSNGLMYGYEDNRFHGERNITRAEACVLIMRMQDAGGFARPDYGDTDNSPVVNAGNLLYISPNGSDSGDGTENSPFKTLEAAQDKIVELSATGKYPEEGITVYLRGGDYILDKSFELSAAGSGKDSAPVVYSSYPGETARITGGVRLDYDKFEPISSDAAQKLLSKSAADKVLQMNLTECGITDLGELSLRGYGITSGTIPQAELYIDGNRKQLARWPNTDWVGTTEIVRSGKRSKTGVLEGAVFKIDYDEPNKWKTNIDEIYTSGVLGENFFFGYFPLEKIERGQITLREGAVTNYYSKHFIRYENIFEELDTPGEYYIDRKSGMLYLYPEEGLGKNSDIWLSQITENLITGSNVSNITIKNLKLEASRAGTIRLSGARNIKVENCEISDTGTNGVYLNGTGCEVKNCIVHDIGSTGISISGGDYENIVSSENVVENNHIYKAAQLERSYQSGILIGYQSVGVTVSHNKIHDMPHAAVIIYGPNHTIEYNEIYDSVKEFDDMDAIYLNVYQYPWERNVVIRRNYIHDLGHETFTERQMNVAGIRSDNNGNGLNVIENVFYNIGYQNSNGMRAICAQGIENVVKNNIFVDTAGTYEGAHTYNPNAKWDTSSDSVKGIYEQWLKYSPKYSEANPEVAHFFDHHFTAYQNNNIFKGNVVVNIQFPLSTVNGTPSAQGYNAADQLMDASDNLVTKEDPGFASYSGQDFTLKPDSVVYKQIEGFPEIDFKNIGLLSDTEVGPNKHGG